MVFFRNKKAGIKETLVGTLLLTAGFLLIIVIWQTFQGKVSAKGAESICQGSIALREKSYTEIHDPYVGAKLGSVATPFLCRTLNNDIPANKGADKQEAEREISELAAKCWNQFGQGLIKDVFKEGDPITKNCFICYTVNLREFKPNVEIKSDELLRYMFETPYKVVPQTDYCKLSGGFCIDSENKQDCQSNIEADSTYILTDKNNELCKKKNKKTCCYTEYDCWNNGGTCGSENPDANKYKEYLLWKCPSSMKCFVKNENYYSYGDYIQKSGGPGNIIITNHLKHGETYAIGFGSPTKECGICTALGIGGGAAATVGGAVALGVPTGGLGAIAVVGVYFATGYFATKGVTQFGAEKYAEIYDRNLNTIYISPLSEMQSGNYCSIVEDVRTK